DTVTLSASGQGLEAEQGNGNGDVTTINAVTITLTKLPVQIDKIAPFWPGIEVDQGGGNKDRITVSNCVVPGNLIINQAVQDDDGAGEGHPIVGVGNNDTVTVSDSSFGFAVAVDFIHIIPFCGLVEITQGDGAANKV